MSRVVFYTHFKEKLVIKSDISAPEIFKAEKNKDVLITIDNSDSKSFEYISSNIGRFSFSTSKFLLL